MTLIGAWNNEGSKSPMLNTVLKEIFSLTVELDIFLNLKYVPSKSNLADEPSRQLDKSDAMLNSNVWHIVQEYFGGREGHTIDLMALDSNCMINKNGRLLKHFSPCYTPLSAGVNMFAQSVSSRENSYVFPPFQLLLPVLAFIKENKLNCTVILRTESVAPVWVPMFFQHIKDAFIVGVKGQKDILLYPTKKGYSSDRFGLNDNLWAIRLDENLSLGFTYGKWLFLKHPLISKNFSLLCLGDSMIRFLLEESSFKNPMIHVYSQGGALISQVAYHVERLAKLYVPKVIIVHAGVNNVSKCFLYDSEYNQLCDASKQLQELTIMLQRLASEIHGVKVIISSIIPTKNDNINARSKILNDQMDYLCRENMWTFMNNSNINIHHLRDNVHLNKEGQLIFIKNLQNIFCSL